MLRITIRDKPRNRCANLAPLRLAILRGIAAGTCGREIREKQRVDRRSFQRTRNDLVAGGFITRDYADGESPFKLTDKGRAALEANP